MNMLRNEIEEQGWTSIDNLMDLLADVIYKFADRSDVTPDEMRKYITAQLETIINKAWDVKLRKAIKSLEGDDVSVYELRADVRLP